MINTLKNYFQKVSDFVWHYDLKTGSMILASIIKFLRIMLVTFNDLSKGHIGLHATSLVYTSLLSLVPFLAVSFAILKGVGLHNYIEPVLLSLLSPLGSQSGVIAAQVVETVENINVGVLGVLGVLILLYTAIALLNKVERVFNTTWHVKPSQSWATRISKYISVLVVGPIFIGLALAATATLSSGDLIGNFMGTLGLSAWTTLIIKTIPYILIIAAFTFFYMFVPSTRVELKPALFGAVLAGVLWEGTGRIFTSIVVSSTNYAAIYAGLAVLILMIIWLYLSWTILLLGSSFAFYAQYPENIRRRSGHTGLSIFRREQLALTVISIILEKFSKGTTAPTLVGLAQSLNQSPENIEAILAPLERKEIIKKTDQKPATYLPGKAPETVPLADVLNIIREQADNALTNKNLSPGVNIIMDKTSAGIQQATANETLAVILNKDTKEPKK